MNDPGSRQSQHERGGSLASLGRNFVWLLGGRGAAAIFSVIYIAILTRSLGPEGFGQFALIVGTAQAVTAFVSFQTWQIVVRFGMERLKAGRERALVRLLKLCLLFDAGGALVGAGLAAGVIICLGPRFGWDPALSWTAFWFAMATLISVRSTAAGILRLYDRFGLSANADAALTAARLIGALVAWILSPTVTAFLVAWGVAEFAAMAVYWLSARYAWGDLQWRAAALSVKETLAETPGLARFAVATNVAQTVVLAGKQLPVLLTGLFIGPAAAGGFQIALQLGRAMATVGRMAVQVLLPEMMRTRTFDDGPDAFQKIVNKALKIGLIAGAVVAGVILLVGKPALVLIAGPPFESAYPLLLIVGVAAAIDLAAVSLEPALYASGRETLALKVRVFVTTIYVGAMVWLGQEDGARGIALATLGAAILGASLLSFALRRALADASAVK